MSFILDGFTMEDVDEGDLEVTSGMISMMALSLLNQYPSFYFDKEDWQKLSQAMLDVLERGRKRTEEHLALPDGFSFYEAQSTYDTFYVMKARNKNDADEDAKSSFGDDKVKLVRLCGAEDAKLYLKEMGFIPTAGDE